MTKEELILQKNELLNKIYDIEVALSVFSIEESVDERSNRIIEKLLSMGFNCSKQNEDFYEKAIDRGIVSANVYGMYLYVHNDFGDEITYRFFETEESFISFLENVNIYKYEIKGSFKSEYFTTKNCSDESIVEDFIMENVLEDLLIIKAKRL